MSSTALDRAEVVDDFSAYGILAFTTSREAGSFGLHTSEPAKQVMERWTSLRESLSGHSPRLATASQVHGSRVLVHAAEWDGWLRADSADGHAAVERGTSMAVTVADCVPIFVAHPSGAAAVLHSGWRGTAARILARGVEALTAWGIAPRELRVHLGPAICGGCYEVSADVYAKLRGRDPGKPTAVDLRELLADQARELGIKHISISPLCTRCNNDRLFSHRAGDEGRQLGVIVAH